MDEREAFQRMRRVQLGSDAPIHANLGRYYEPFEECVAPISTAAMESSFPPILLSTPAPPALFEGPMIRVAPSPQFPHIEETGQDISPIQTIHLPQVFSQRPIGPMEPYICSPSGMSTRPFAKSGLTRIGSARAEDLGSIDGVNEETGEYTMDSKDESSYTGSMDEEEEYATSGPSNLRGKKSIRWTGEQTGPSSLKKSTPNRTYKARVVADEDNFPHPPIPNPGDAREQAAYNIGKRRWWSQRVLRPLLSASPKPLSKDAILSIIKKDLALEGNAWKAFYDEHLVSVFTL
jgi:hypothetical protein